MSTYGTGTYGSGTYGTFSGGGGSIPTALTVAFEVAFTDPPGTVSPTWSDLQSRLVEFKIGRGRQMELDLTETGQLSALLRNQDRQLDPFNTSSAYYPNVIPIRQSRLKVSVLGVEYDLFRGDIQDWVQDWQGVQNYTPVEALDAFDALTGDFSLTRPAELSGARINAILDQLLWPAGMRDIDTGQSRVQATTYAGAIGVTALQDVAHSEQGVIFVDPSGNIVFHERHRRWTAPHNVSQVTFSNEPTGAEVPFTDATLIYSKERIKNYVTVNNEGGITELRYDPASLTQYRYRPYTTSTILEDPGDVASTADYLLAKAKDAVPRVETLVIEPQQDDDLWQYALGLEIGDKVTTIIRPPGTPASTITSDGVIERIEHSYSAEAMRWTTVFRLSPADVSTYWIVGVAEIGTDTRVAF